MKMVAVFCVMVGAICFWSFLGLDAQVDREKLRSEMLIANFSVYRAAVNDYVAENRMIGIVPYENLKISPGWNNIGNWRNMVVAEGEAHLFCYVYGDAVSANDRAAAQRLFKYSPTVGFNINGQWIRNGSQMALPAQIPNGAIVSVIKVAL
jgi:hypothetical protein